MSDPPATEKDIIRLDQRHNTTWRAHLAQHAQDRHALDKRLEVANGHDAQMSEMSRNFITKESYERAHEPLIKRLDAAETENRRRFELLENTTRDRFDLIAKEQRLQLRPLEDDRAGRVAIITALIAAVSIIGTIVIVVNVLLSRQ